MLVRPLFCLVAVLGCGNDSPPHGRASSDSARVSDGAKPSSGSLGHGRDSLLQTVYDYGLAFGETRAQITAKLGLPQSAFPRTTQNTYTAATDSIFDVRYPGLRFWIIRLGADGREFLGGVQVTDSTPVLPGGIRCHLTTRQTVRELLGDPSHSTYAGDTLVAYYARLSIGPDEYVQFRFLLDTLRLVHWDLYVD